MASSKPGLKTLVVDNFKGDVTNYYFGDINSGRSWYQTVSGQNPFLKPGQLTWSEAPVQIDPNGSVITDLIVAGKERVESGILYVYAIGHTGRLYKIQVNNPASYTADYDNPVLLTTLTINNPTFKNGGFMEFFGSPSLIYIGHDTGLTKINFNGTGETYVGAQGSWVQNVPRPLKQFVGNLYVGNGSNIAEFGGSSLIINTYTRLAPGFPGNTQIRDMDLTVDGNYLIMVANTIPLFDITSSVQETTSNASANSYIFFWNGTDVAATSETAFPTFSLNATLTFQQYQYAVGTDQFGTAIFNPSQKILALPEVPYISPNAISSAGNLFMELSPVYFQGFLQAVMYIYGAYDFEIGASPGPGFWSPFFILPKAPQTDIAGVPFMLPVSNEGIGLSSNSYTGNIFGTSKIYFSTLETNASSTAYRFYRWKASNSLTQPISTNVLNQALYQTQTQMFGRKMSIHEIRIYGDPWISGNSFQIDLNGSASQQLTPISGGTRVFTAGGNLPIGTDMISYNPGIAPTYCVGLSITNLGTVNHTINKIEIDYSEAGK